MAPYDLTIHTYATDQSQLNPDLIWNFRFDSIGLLNMKSIRTIIFYFYEYYLKLKFFVFLVHLLLFEFIDQ